MGRSPGTGTSTSRPGAASAVPVDVSEDTLTAELVDGRTVSVPLAWYPRLLHGTTGERANWRLIGGGNGIHWPELDEDISVDNLLVGQPSGESQESLRKWLGSRTATKVPGQQSN